MENSSRALLIAGEILIALLILTLGIQIYLEYSKEAEIYHESMSAKETEKFNGDFIKYIEINEGGIQYIKSQDLITIANYAEDTTNNQGYNVNIIMGTYTNKSLAEEILGTTNMMYKDDGTLIYYQITSITYNESGRLVEIKIGSEISL